MKTIVSVKSKHFDLTLVQKKENYVIIRETKKDKYESLPMKDLKLALNIFDDFYNELETKLN